MREVTKNIKRLADTKPLNLAEIDALLQEAEARELVTSMEAGSKKTKLPQRKAKRQERQEKTEDIKEGANFR